MNVNINCQHASELQGLFDHLGAPGRFVGGCVRDTLAGLPVKDYDLATSARPEDVMSVADGLGHRVIPTGLQHGTVTVVIEHEPYEITTLRADVETDGRHAKVQFVQDFRIDAERRDFTFNAMSVDFDGRLYDYFGGVEDLRERRVRFVGSMDDRITEDYLRILRYFRFQARYGGNERKEQLETIARHAHGLKRISGERIWSELSRILVSERAGRALRDMNSSGVLDASGLSVNMDNITADALAYNSHAKSEPGIMLGIVATDTTAIENASERWRISSRSLKMAHLAHVVRARVKSALLSEDYAAFDPDFWLDMAVDGESVDDLRQIIRTMGNFSVLQCLPLEVPRFPVMGKDLIERGMRPGREIGDVLRSLASEWKESRYSLSREELLASQFNGKVVSHGI